MWTKNDEIILGFLLVGEIENKKFYYGKGKLILDQGINK